MEAIHAFARLIGYQVLLLAAFVVLLIVGATLPHLLGGSIGFLWSKYRCTAFARRRMYARFARTGKIGRHG